VFACSAEAGLYLVGHTESAVLARDAIGFTQIVRRSVCRATDTLNRLGDERGNFPGRRVADDTEDVFRASDRDFLGRPAESAPIWIWRNGVVNPRRAGNRILPGVVGSEPHRAGRSTVISVAQRHHVGVARVQPRHRDREVIGFAAIVDEVRDVQTLRHLRSELLRQQRKVRVQIDRRRVLERLDLLLDRGDDLRVTVTARDGNDPRKHIQVPPTGFVVEVLHVTLDD
jgi:hypothetical protein